MGFLFYPISTIFCLRLGQAVTMLFTGKDPFGAENVQELEGNAGSKMAEWGQKRAKTAKMGFLFCPISTIFCLLLGRAVTMLCTGKPLFGAVIVQELVGNFGSKMGPKRPKWGSCSTVLAPFSVSVWAGQSPHCALGRTHLGSNCARIGGKRWIKRGKWGKKNKVHRSQDLPFIAPLGPLLPAQLLPQMSAQHSDCPAQMD